MVWLGKWCSGGVVHGGFLPGTASAQRSDVTWHRAISDGSAATLEEIRVRQVAVGFEPGPHRLLQLGIDANYERDREQRHEDGLLRQSKSRRLRARAANEGVPIQALASFMAGFFMTCTVAPFDICRSANRLDKPRSTSTPTVREDRTQEGPPASARIHTHVGSHRADDDAPAPLQVLQAGGHLGDVDVVVVESRYDPPCFYVLCRNLRASTSQASGTAASHF